MPIRIQAYTEDMVPRVREFNGRLRRGAVGFQFPEHHCSTRLPWTEGATVHEEYFLAVEDGQVCGGYILKSQGCSFAGRSVPSAYYRLPLSAGVIDRRYAILGVKLLQDALSRQPVLLGAGMGGLHTPIAKLLAMSQWGLHAVPFFFRIVRPYRFLKGLSYLRDGAPRRRVLLDLLAASGAGWLATHLLQWRLGWGATARSDCDLVEEFGGWADVLWREHRNRYAMVAHRDTATLNALYPVTDPRFLRVKVLHKDRVVGWAVALDAQMSRDKYFGNLRVGSIADAFSAPEAAPTVVWAVTRFLEQRGVDLIVSHQCHVAWCRALRTSGYLKGPTNFILGVSPRVLDALEPFDVNKRFVHLNRGDCDGPDLL